MSRVAVVDKELCKPEKCQQECANVCPPNRKGDACIVIGKDAVIDESLCIDCGLCIKYCPFKAIDIVGLPEELKEMPVHRFGVNEFVLYRLPVPVKGVVGLLGPNGVGKSTALKILAGQISPNIGNLEKEDMLDEIIKLNRGNELHDYLQKLSQKNIRTVYKPQQVGLLPKLYKGKVSALLKDVPSQILEKLEITHCLQQNIGELSGGELQRVMIAQALSKDADIYYFDEPSSFLDVKQRLSVAKIIRELAENKFVVVVEHDLATLDFLADRIHIFYGAPAVYGIVSKPYAAAKGINMFLDGYIPEENMRIRDPIKFEQVTMEKKKKREVLTSFSEIKKSYENFSLHVQQGEIYKSEVLGILGANALGKTTFAKILAGQITAQGDVYQKVTVAYKPQYIESSFDGTVFELLAAEKNTMTDDFKMISRVLNLEQIHEKTVKDLSGGELQRVAIALCLAKDAHLYLLDEPCAYLDVDQRLSLAKLLRSFSTIVIDHDLLFLSYVSDRVMLFTGTPGKEGRARTMEVKDGFNIFLKEMNITFRRDPHNKRPRANSPGSQKDREQKQKGVYFG